MKAHLSLRTCLGRLALSAAGLFVPEIYIKGQSFERDLPFRRQPSGGSQSSPLASSIAVTGNQVNYALTIGFRFQPVNTITITDIGRWMISGNAATHTIGIWKYDTGVLIGSTSVNLSGQTPGQWIYASLASPITLANPHNTTDFWCCASIEQNPGDKVLDCNGGTDTSINYNTTDVAISGSVFSSGANFGIAEGSSGTPGKSFVPMNFKYHT